MVLLKKSETTEQPLAIKSLLEHLTRTVYCETDTLKLCVCAILAGGHILIEDVPGVGKTTLANSLAILLGLDFRRLQFTSDLLPTDITGISIYNPDTKKFEFIAGPVFTSVLLADEINRANPRAQSALLEAMEENSVSVDGKTMPLPQPFYVLATQNPTEQSGTFPLPESQLDRFLLRVSLGYPSAKLERDLLAAGDRRKIAGEIGAVCSPETLSSMIANAADVHCSASLIDYMQRLLKATREDPAVVNGLSPRAGLQWLAAARAAAYMEGRKMALPEDIQWLAQAVTAHRLKMRDGASAAEAVSRIIETVGVV